MEKEKSNNNADLIWEIMLILILWLEKLELGDSQDTWGLA